MDWYPGKIIGGLRDKRLFRSPAEKIAEAQFTEDGPKRWAGLCGYMAIRVVLVKMCGATTWLRGFDLGSNF